MYGEFNQFSTAESLNSQIGLSDLKCKIANMTDDDLFNEALAGKEQENWTVGLLIALQDRGLDVLDKDPALKSLIEKKLASTRESMRLELKPFMSGMAKIQSQIGNATLVNSLKKLSDSLNLQPSSYHFGFSEDLIRSISNDKTLKSTQIPYESLSTLSRNLLNNVVVSNPALVDAAIDSPQVIGVSNRLIENSTHEVLNQISEATQATARNTSGSLWERIRDWITSVFVLVTTAITIYQFFTE